MVKGRRRESTILAGNLSYQDSVVVSSTSAEISVIRKPQGTLRTQDVLLEEEEDEEERDDQSSFQSCTSSPLVQIPQEDQDSRLTEVEGLNDRSRGSMATEERSNDRMTSRLGGEVGQQLRLTPGETGSNTPSQKIPLVTGLSLSCVKVYIMVSYPPSE